MTEQFYTIMTNVGKASIANASALGKKVDFQFLALGDGNGGYYNPTEEQTELKNEVWRGQISHVVVDEDNPNWVQVSTVIPALVGGFSIREMGMFDTEGNMLAVGKYPETYKPTAEDGSTKDLVIRMVIEVSNASVVTLKIDPTVILVTKKDLEDLKNDVDKKLENIEFPVTSVNKKTGSVILKTSDIKDDEGKTIDEKFENVSSEIGNIEIPVISVNDKTGAIVLDATDITLSSGKTVEDGIQEAFQSASDGKVLVAGAITGKGVSTSPSDTFKTMATNIGKIETDKTGDATAVVSDILAGKTAYAKGSKLAGTMANRGNVANTITTNNGSYTIPAGYHAGSGKVTATFENLIAGNVRSGVNVGGVVGNLKPYYEASGGPFTTTSLTVDNLSFRPVSVIIYGSSNRATLGAVYGKGTSFRGAPYAPIDSYGNGNYWKTSFAIRDNGFSVYSLYDTDTTASDHTFSWVAFG